MVTEVVEGKGPGQDIVEMVRSLHSVQTLSFILSSYEVGNHVSLCKGVTLQLFWVREKLEEI